MQGRVLSWELDGPVGVFLVGQGDARMEGWMDTGSLSVGGSSGGVLSGYGHR